MLGMDLQDLQLALFDVGHHNHGILQLSDGVLHLLVAHGRVTNILARQQSETLTSASLEASLRLRPGQPYLQFMTFFYPQLRNFRQLRPLG